MKDSGNQNSANPSEETASQRFGAEKSGNKWQARGPWTVHWTSDDGRRPYHQDFTEPHEAANWVRVLLEKGKTMVSVIGNDGI